MKPWTTPLYSDAAFQLLGYAIESITGRPYKQILADRVISPLGLTRSFLDHAPEEYGIIPGTVNSTLWYGQLGDLNP
jgi:CubicO group peptidase (beta-lactamase class C family)